MEKLYYSAVVALLAAGTITNPGFSPQNDTSGKSYFIQSYQKSETADSIAYSRKQPSTWVSDKQVFVVTKKDFFTIPVNFSNDFIVAGWSPDNSYIFVLEESDYYGGLQGHILSTSEQQEVLSFTTLNKEIYWIDENRFIFFDPTADCAPNTPPEKCTNTATSAKLFDLNAGSNSEITRVPSAQGMLPLIYEVKVNKNKLSFKYSFDYSKSESKTHFQVNLDIKDKQ